MLDTVIVGGSVAGLSAALYLGRSLRRITLFDTNQPCNRFSHAAHGFLTRDHVPPGEILAIAREQLARYETVTMHTGKVVKIAPEAGHFAVSTEDGEKVQARKVLLATGLSDGLPLIPGIGPLWGKSVLHCAYCDGWEQRNQPLALHANGSAALHNAFLLRNLTDDLVLCTGEPVTFSEEDQARLQKYGIRVIETPILALRAEGEQLQAILFDDGTELARRALFVQLKLGQHSPLAQELGCATTETGLIQVDEWGQTTVAGLYAAGDMATRARQIIFAANSGATAAIGIHMALLHEDFK